MSQTAPPPPPPPSPSSAETAAGPRVSAGELRDLGRMRRPNGDRKLAGVCSGLARHLDVDPTIIRVVMVVLVFFGGAGLLLYAALWLLLPDEGSGRAIVNPGGEVAKVLIVVAAGVAAVIALGAGFDGWSGWWWGPSLPVAVLLLVAVGLLLSRDRRTRATPPANMSTSSTESTEATAELPVPAAAPAWTPPPYKPPRRPHRTGRLLFWPTLAVIAVALGALGLYDAGHQVATGAYWALALAITGAALVLGAFRGRAGGLVLAGLLATAGLIGSVVAGDVRSADDLTYTPTVAADVRPSYVMKAGAVDLDLTQVSDPAALDGRTVRLRGKVGELRVTVPREVTSVVRARVHTAGGITISNLYDQGAVGGSSADYTLRGPTGAPTITLDADLRVGQIQVRYPDE